MKRMKYLALLLAIVGVALVGCSRQGDPVIPDDPGMSPLSGQTTPVREIGELCVLFEISGAVYTDADQDGARSLSEPGIANVTVTLEDGDGEVQMTTTDASGDYSFLMSAGTYVVRIDAATEAADFNETLASSFNPTGPASRTVTVGPDSPDNDFGFDPRAEEIALEIQQGTIPTTGEPVKFWQKHVRMAMSGGRDHVEFDAATMALFITEIQGLFLPDPFVFTPGSEFQEAWAILKAKSKDPVEQLRRELLAAEFNEVSGKGLVGSPELQRIILAWAESLLFEASSPVSLLESDSPAGPKLGAANYPRISDAINLLEELNGAIGGGSGGGG